MRLTLRLLAILVALIMVLLSIEGIMFGKREEQDLESNVRHSQVQLGAALRRALNEIAEKGKLPEIRSFLAEFRGDESSVAPRLVRIDDPPGSEFAPRSDGAKIRQSLHDGMSMQTDQETNSLLTYVVLDLPFDPSLMLELRDEQMRLKKTESGVIRRLVVVMTILVVGGGIASSFLGVMFVGRPLKQLVAKTQQIAAGDFERPVTLHGGDELAELGVALDRMGTSLATAHRRIVRETEERIAALEQLRHADRLKTVGQFASGIAHELGTPLNVILGRASLIADGGLSDSDTKRSAQIVREQATRMTGLIRQFLDFARRGSPKRVRCDLAQLVLDTRDLMASLGDKGRVVVLPSRGDCVVLADPAQIQQVITNLAVNALQAVTKSGNVSLSCERIQRSEGGGDSVRLRVEDDGIGITRDVIPRIFDPFFTTKDVGQGTGLGLTIVHGIVRDHGGEVIVTSEVGKGSRFDVVLPAASATLPPKDIR